MEQRYVGIDLHRRRSVIYTMDADGEKLDSIRIANDPMTLLAVVGKAGRDAEVVIEATYGWYWAVDLLQLLRLERHFWDTAADSLRTKRRTSVACGSAPDSCPSRASDLACVESFGGRLVPQFAVAAPAAGLM